jgi:hypothetical protein
MIFYAAVPLTVFVVLLQVAAAPSFVYLGVHADLPVVWLTCWAAVRGRQEVLPLIAVAGFGLGLLGREPVGASLLALLPIAALAFGLDLHAGPGKYLLTLAAVIVAGVAFNVVHALASVAGGDSIGSPIDILRVAPRAALLDVLTAALWYWPMRLVFRRRLPARQFGGG